MPEVGLFHFVKADLIHLINKKKAKPLRLAFLAFNFVEMILDCHHQ